MTKQELIHHINNVHLLNATHKEELNTLVENFPWFQTAHLLHTKSLQNIKDLTFESKLNKTAAHVSDRRILFELLQNETKIQNEKLEVIDKEESSIEEISNEPEITAARKESIVQTESEIVESIDAINDEIKSSESGSLGKLEEQILSSAVGTSIAIDIEKELFNEDSINTENINTLDKSELTSENIIEEEIIEVESTTEVKTPLPESFTDWLKNSKLNSINDENTEVVKQTKKSVPSKNLIDKFIQEEPKISKPKKEFYSPIVQGKLSLEEDNWFVTETLARIYENQEDYSKAINAYEILGLKFPEKKVYFANRIEKIESLKKQKKK